MIVNNHDWNRTGSGRRWCLPFIYSCCCFLVPLPTINTQDVKKCIAVNGYVYIWLQWVIRLRWSLELSPYMVKSSPLWHVDNRGKTKQRTRPHSKKVEKEKQVYEADWHWCGRGWVGWLVCKLSGNTVLCALALSVTLWGNKFKFGTNFNCIQRWTDYISLTLWWPHCCR